MSQDYDAGDEAAPDLAPSTSTIRPGHATMATVASHMGLSRATVAHVLNGRAVEQRIRPETQRRVLEAAEELGYRPNVSARAVREGRFGSVALIQSLLRVYLPTSMLHGISLVLADRDVNLVMTEAPEVGDDESYLSHTMRALSVDGILVNRHAGFSQPFLDRIHRLRIPAVFLNVRQEFDCVHPDELMGGRLAAEFLLRLGHERIAYIDTAISEEPHFSRRDRRAGFEQEVVSAGRTPQNHLLPGPWWNPDLPGEDLRVEAVRALLSGPDRPTAVVAYELLEAMAVVHAAQTMGLQIPQDLSVVVFHEWYDARFFRHFHTICTSMTEVGSGAAGMLLEKIESPDIPLPARAIPVRLLEGATCLPRR